MKRRLLDILTIMVGSFIFALAINVLIIPTNLGEGGVTGLRLSSIICSNGLLDL